MKTTAWRWLVLLLIPGCLLVQPLDDAKPANEDSGGSGSNSAGKPGQAGSAGKPGQAGSAGQHAGGSGSGVGGTGNRAGSGAVPPGGSANGGATSGVDFSLFTGTWTITGGQSTTSCDGATPQTSTVAPGGTDTFGLGNISDLIFDPGTDCEILADVDDRTASLNPATLDCYTSDANYDYDLSVISFDFVVSGDGKTAKATMSASILVSDGSGGLSVCDADYTWNYKR